MVCRMRRSACIASTARGHARRDGEALENDRLLVRRAKRVESRFVEVERILSGRGDARGHVGRAREPDR